MCVCVFVCACVFVCVYVVCVCVCVCVVCVCVCLLSLQSFVNADGSFKASTPLQGFDLSTLRPSFSAAYNFTNRSSVQLGVKSGSSTQINFGYLYRW